VLTVNRMGGDRRGDLAGHGGARGPRIFQLQGEGIFANLFGLGSNDKRLTTRPRGGTAVIGLGDGCVYGRKSFRGEFLAVVAVCL